MSGYQGRAEFNPDNGVCTMTFDKKLAEFLKELKKLYSKINLSDLGRLQSRYALRIFEMAMSYAELFGIKPDEYQENCVFRQRVIEGPIKEINESGIGVEIKTEGIKKGRSLTGFRFDCKKVPDRFLKELSQYHHCII